MRPPSGLGNGNGGFSREMLSPGWPVRWQTSIGAILIWITSLERARVSGGCLVALVGVCAACDKAAEQGQPPAGAAETKQRPGAPRARGPSSETLELRAELASPTAFDLIATYDGAKLVWAPRGENFRLLEQPIARDGRLKGGSASLASGPSLAGSAARGRATDLVAAQLDRGVAVAWVEQLGNEARASALVSDARGAPELSDLGAAWPTGTVHRGNIALAGAREYALVFVRGTEEPCSEGQSQCFGFGLYRLEPEGAAHARGLPLSVPVPCSEYSTLLAISEGRWHYAVCTLAGAAPVTTLFNIQFEPEYAAAEQLLQGCRPRGLFEHAGDVWLSGDCAGARSAVRGTGKQRAVYDLSGLVFDCSSGEARVVGGDFELRFGAPQTQVHAFLGPPWVPAHARAVWTGGALVVAAEQGGSVRLTRYACG